MINSSFFVYLLFFYCTIRYNIISSCKGCDLSMNDEFQSIGELYQRVMPALQTKVGKLHKKGITTVGEDDIWNLLMEKWKNGKGLTLFDIVHDIMSLDEKVIIDKFKIEKDS